MLRHLSFKLIIFFSLFFILSQCDPDYGFDPRGDGFQVIVTETIDQLGGEIFHEDIIVDIPAGAVSEPVNIRILKDTTNASHGFGSHAISHLFQIDSILGGLAKPIRVRLPIEESELNNLVIMAGSETKAPSLDSVLYSYQQQDSWIEDGFLIADIYPEAFQLKASSSEPRHQFKATVLGLKKYDRQISADGLFELCYPVQYMHVVPEVLAIFNEAKETFQDIGFKFERPTWPLKITLNPSVQYGYYTYHYDTYLYFSDRNIRQNLYKGNMTLGTNILHEAGLTEMVVFHELVHFLQNIYEFGADVWGFQEWLLEASAVWGQSFSYSNPDFVPINIEGWEMKFFDGLVKNQTGYGHFFMCQALEEYYGENIIAEIFQKIKDGINPTEPVSPVEAIESLVEEPIELIWYYTLNEYLQGLFPMGQEAIKIWNSKYSTQKVYEFTGENDNNLYQIENNYTNLGADIFFFDFSNLSLDGSYNVYFELPDNAMNGLGLYTYDGKNKVQVLGGIMPGNVTDFTVKNIQIIANQGLLLCALLSVGDHSGRCMDATDVKINYQLEKSSGGDDDILPGTYNVISATANHTDNLYPDQNFSYSDGYGTLKVRQNSPTELYFTLDVRSNANYYKKIEISSKSGGEEWSEEFPGFVRTINRKITVKDNTFNAKQTTQEVYDDGSVWTRDWEASGDFER